MEGRRGILSFVLRLARLNFEVLVGWEMGCARLHGNICCSRKVFVRLHSYDETVQDKDKYAAGLHDLTVSRTCVRLQKGFAACQGPLFKRSPNFRV